MNSEKIYDVAIIGGGLAGLSMAIQCAKENCSVILFEKETYPFHKVCGEYISNESYDFIKSLGVNLQLQNLPVITKLSLSDSQGKMYSFNLPLGGFGISRFSLDNQLYQIATAIGVRIEINSKVETAEFANELFTIKSSHFTIQSRVTIASFGKRSNLDVKWRRPFAKQKVSAYNNYIGIKYHIKLKHNQNEITLHNFKDGYCGISKIEEDKSCLCYLTTAENLKRNGNTIQEMETQVLYKNPRIKEIFTNARFLYDKPLSISQVSFAKKQQVENHILMVGDAAGMISPLCGNGMSMAMHSSKIAAKTVIAFLNKETSRNQMEEEYINLWNKQFSSRLLTGRLVQRFFGGDTSTSIFLRTMKTFPSLANIIIKTTHGKPF